MDLEMVGRRLFLCMTGAFAVAPLSRAQGVALPAMLDHILLGSSDLQRGIDHVHRHTGVRATLGGVHPGRGTCNALLSLGDRRYLEIIAPDPQQASADNPLVRRLRALREPSLITWAAQVRDLVGFAKTLAATGVVFNGPTAGSRTRPDGRLLQWLTLTLVDDHSGLLPFFIEWAPDTVHPSVDAPKGCVLHSFEARVPETSTFVAELQRLDLDLSVHRGSHPHLRAILAGSNGNLALSS